MSMKKLYLLGSALAVLIIFVSSAPLAAQCSSGAPNHKIYGSANDTHNGTSACECVDGNGGDDSLDGNAGDDWLYGGSGDDTLKRGSGDGHISMLGMMRG